jgi:hypothetical protein
MKTDGLFMNTKYYECLGTELFLIWQETANIIQLFSSKLMLHHQIS